MDKILNRTIHKEEKIQIDPIFVNQTEQEVVTTQKIDIIQPTLVSNKTDTYEVEELVEIRQIKPHNQTSSVTTVETTIIETHVKVTPKNASDVTVLEEKVITKRPARIVQNVTEILSKNVTIEAQPKITETSITSEVHVFDSNHTEKI